MKAVWRDRNVQFALLLRAFVVLFLPDVLSLIERRPEINTLGTSLRHLQETAFLLKSGAPVYDFGKVLPAPLLTFAFDALKSCFKSDLLLRFIFIAVDFFIAFLLAEVSGINELALVHLLNPLSIMTCLGRNLGLISVLSIMGSLVAAKRNKTVIAAVCLSVAIYLDIRSTIFAFPVILMSKSNTVIIQAVSFTVILFAVSASLTSPLFFESVYWSRLRVDDLRPNAGLFWYLHQQVFLAFKDLFKLSFQLISAAFVIPCVLKFNQDPLFLAFILQASQTIMKADPSGADYVLLCGLLGTQFRKFGQTRIVFIMMFGLLGIFVFMMAVWDYWIRYNGFNANFYYAFTLALNIVWVMITLEMVLAHQKTAIYETNTFLNEKEFEKCKLIQR